MKYGMKLHATGSEIWFNSIQIYLNSSQFQNWIKIEFNWIQIQLERNGM